MSKLFDFFFSGTISRRLDALEAQGRVILATVVDLQTKLQDLETAINDERSEVQSLLENLRDEIQALQDQIGAGQLVTQEQLDALASSADALVARVRDISEPVSVE